MVCGIITHIDDKQKERTYEKKWIPAVRNRSVCPGSLFFYGDICAGCTEGQAEKLQEAAEIEGAEEEREDSVRCVCLV